MINKGIIATINDSIFAVKKKYEENYVIPHGKKVIDNAIDYKDELSSDIKIFNNIDSAILNDFISKIKNNDIISIGENTFNQCFPLLKKNLEDKNIFFLIFNKKSLQFSKIKKDDWFKKSIDINIINKVNIFDNNFNYNNLNKFISKLDIDKKDITNHILGGASVYSFFANHYNTFTQINLNSNKYNKFMLDHCYNTKNIILNNFSNLKKINIDLSELK